MQNAKKNEQKRIENDYENDRPNYFISFCNDFFISALTTKTMEGYLRVKTSFGFVRVWVVLDGQQISYYELFDPKDQKPKKIKGSLEIKDAEIIKISNEQIKYGVKIRAAKGKVTFVCTDTNTWNAWFNILQRCVKLHEEDEERKRRPKEAREILNIPEEKFGKLTKEMIGRAYKRLCLKEHPDKGGDAEKFHKIHQSYKLLLTLQQEQHELENSEIIRYEVVIEKVQGVGLGLSVTEDKFKARIFVSGVNPNTKIVGITEEAEGEIKVNDILIGIDNDDCSNWLLTRIRSRLDSFRVPLGEKVTFTFERRILMTGGNSDEDDENYSDKWSPRSPSPMKSANKKSFFHKSFFDSSTQDNTEPEEKKEDENKNEEQPKEESMQKESVKVEEHEKDREEPVLLKKEKRNRKKEEESASADPPIVLAPPEDTNKNNSAPPIVLSTNNNAEIRAAPVLENNGGRRRSVAGSQPNKLVSNSRSSFMTLPPEENIAGNNLKGEQYEESNPPIILFGNSEQSQNKKNVNRNSMYKMSANSLRNSMYSSDLNNNNEENEETENSFQQEQTGMNKPQTRNNSYFKMTSNGIRNSIYSSDLNDGDEINNNRSNNQVQEESDEIEETDPIERQQQFVQKELNFRNEFVANEEVQMTEEQKQIQNNER
jgi:hypothetical protein